jgi:hypothetical protein
MMCMSIPNFQICGVIIVLEISFISCTITLPQNRISLLGPKPLSIIVSRKVNRQRASGSDGVFLSLSIALNQ